MIKIQKIKKSPEIGSRRNYFSYYPYSYICDKNMQEKNI